MVILDDAEVAKVRRGQRVELPIAPGHHEVFLKIGWCRSPAVAVDAQPGDVIELYCAPGGSASEGLGDVLGNTQNYISLTRVGA